MGIRQAVSSFAIDRQVVKHDAVECMFTIQTAKLGGIRAEAREGVVFDQDVVQVTIVRNVYAGRFQRRGSIAGYVRWIAFCRAVDLLRRRPPIDPEADITLLPGMADDDDDGDDTPAGEIVRMILQVYHAIATSEPDCSDDPNAVFEPLTEQERLVMLDFVRLAIESGTTRPVRTEELMASVNKELEEEHREPLTPDAVKNTKRRAIAKLLRKGNQQ